MHLMSTRYNALSFETEAHGAQRESTHDFFDFAKFGEDIPQLVVAHAP